MLNSFFKKIESVAVWLVLLLTLIGSLNAILRYLGNLIQLNLSSNLFLEIQWYFFSVIFLIGFSITHIKNRNIRVDVFYEKFRQSRKNIVNNIGKYLLFLPMVLVIIFLSIGYFISSIAILEQSPDTDGIPRYIIKFFIPFGYILLLLTIFLIKKDDN